MHVAAAPKAVFGYFTDPARYVQWMGNRATLEPDPAVPTVCRWPTVMPPLHNRRS